MHHNGQVVTIFSAPNYCDFTGNKGAFIRLRGDEMKPKYTQFDAVVISIIIYSHILTLVQWHMQTNLEECFEYQLFILKKYLGNI